ncbi:PepSY-associated TM helix domain-containing protein [Pseudomonas eucalypticola]|uniref:PepSY domain-containing protein n=1 Tax=Pseudomonas eucalypticola TaxID=2599595 RepID=A0A7D5H6T0_9PSED|nr:PepSY-associated TM helix domain-containing protein [Pseudomonas eucalypticola]QKZ05469.1 PepSY domain-containing protein [Pseudomonas eucalypticola]
MSEPVVKTAPGAPGPLLALLKRLHFYVGLLVGPFLLVAALSGVLYALTPQLENQLYDQALHTASRGPALSLATQVAAAQAAVGPTARVAALRPAPNEGDTTRVMFNQPGLGASANRAIFIDPVTAQVRGDLPVYGTSGVLPLRTWIDQFHRGLLLGEVGRLYSELAASWLWVAALGGVALWVAQRRRKASALRRWHATTGLWLLVGLLFFSATGLTWSQWAGGNIGVLRGWWGWSTPSVSTELGQPMTMNMPMDEHAQHHGMKMAALPVLTDLALFDQVLASARAADIRSPKVEIAPPAAAGKAWTVTEIDRRWPTHVDAAAIDPGSLKVVSTVRFADYPLAAKLTRWGIDAHMGALFGVANQVVLVVFASGLAVMVVWGYVLWWRRRPILVIGKTRPQGLVAACRALSPAQRIGVLAVAIALGLALPVLGGSLVLFVAWDALAGRTRSQWAPIEERY